MLSILSESFKEGNKPAKSTAILEKLLSPIFKAYFTFLAYILPFVTDLNRQFHSEGTQIHSLYNWVCEVCKTIVSHFFEVIVLGEDQSISDIVQEPTAFPTCERSRLWQSWRSPVYQRKDLVINFSYFQDKMHKILDRTEWQTKEKFFSSKYSLTGILGQT